MTLQNKFNHAAVTAQDKFEIKAGHRWSLAGLARATRNAELFIEAEIEQDVIAKGRPIDSPQIEGTLEWEITFETGGCLPYVAVIDIPDQMAA